MVIEFDVAIAMRFPFCRRGRDRISGVHGRQPVGRLLQAATERPAGVPLSRQ